MSAFSKEIFSCDSHSTSVPYIENSEMDAITELHNYIMYYLTGAIFIALWILVNFITLERIRKGGSMLKSSFVAWDEFIMRIHTKNSTLIFYIIILWLTFNVLSVLNPDPVAYCSPGDVVPLRILNDTEQVPTDVVEAIEKTQYKKRIMPNSYFDQFPDYDSMTDQEKSKLIRHTTDLVNIQNNEFQCVRVSNSMFHDCKSFGKLVNGLLKDKSPEYYRLYSMGPENNKKVLGNLLSQRADFIKAINGDLE